MEKEMNMKQGNWYARHADFARGWYIRQEGGSFLKNEDGSLAYFTRSEADFIISSLNSRHA